MIAQEHSTRILVVDDRPENLYSFERTLTPLRCALDLAGSAQEAFRHLLHANYACILCDIQMPDIDGYELVASLRADPEHAETPVIFVTAHSPSNDRVLRAFALGACDLVTKPVEPAILRAKVNAFMSLYQRRVQIERQRDLFEATMANLRDAVFVLSEEGVTFANDALWKLVGQPARLDLLMDTLLNLQFCHPLTRGELAAEDNPFRLALESKPVANREVLLLSDRTPTGEYWSVNVVPIETRASRTRQIAVVVRDVTPERVALMNIQQKNQELEQFAYAASHDLKAPLRHVAAFSSILESEIGSLELPVAKQALGFISRGIQDMRSLVDGLLALSLAGAQGLQRCRIHLERLVAEVWSRELSAAVPADAMLLLEPDLPDLWADREAMRRVLANVLGNAIKFRRRDVPLVINVSAEVLAGAHRVVITDNGIGIRPEHAARVFQVFQRLHNKDQYDGSGIGLALCRKVIELHGGRIWVRPNPEPGAILVFELPRSPDRSVPTAP